MKHEIFMQPMKRDGRYKIKREDSRANIKYAGMFLHRSF
jgi:hypothetical protein